MWNPLEGLVNAWRKSQEEAKVLWEGRNAVMTAEETKAYDSWINSQMGGGSPGIGPVLVMQCPVDMAVIDARVTAQRNAGMPAPTH